MSEQTKDDRRNIAQIGRMIRSIVEVETLDQCYWVGGKVAHYHKSNLGHIYFDLVDGYSRIRCMQYVPPGDSITDLFDSSSPSVARDHGTQIMPALAARHRISCQSLYQMTVTMLSPSPQLLPIHS